MKPVPTKKKRPRGKWKDSHVVLFVLPVVLTILYPGRGIFYLHGRFSPYASTRMAVIWLFPIPCFFILWCSFWGIVRLVRSRQGRTRNEVLLIAAEACVLLICAGFLAVSFHFPQVHPYKVKDLFMFGLRDRIESKADIEATRYWLQSLTAEEYEGENRISSAEVRKSLGVRKYTSAKLLADENGKPKVRLAWGSAVMGYWGAVIGMKDMKIPPSESSPEAWVIMPVEPGVYVWWGE
jgi:hypothetical protein